MSDLQEALAWVRINCREEATTRLRSRRVAKALADEIERLTAELSKWHETSAEELNFWKKEAESLKSERDALKKVLSYLLEHQLYINSHAKAVIKCALEKLK